MIRPEVLPPRRTRTAERAAALACFGGLPLLLLLAWLQSGCSPAIRATGRCPTLPTLAADFVISSALLGASVARLDGHPAETPILFSSAMLVGLAANLSECRR